ncbi:glutamate racemase [Mucilaginibacter daejeonensis]|uniref:glutamate racemase n=1 Tax=Mucilaginibacter daejeonensis TaxID=398049 RepID=UPI001D171EE3|nr:glutamate racemase [Mucilaginibacter daejeonensis]UEG54749.1 glutamate racemase [Mucilaginibacter daejeonensis]
MHNTRPIGIFDSGIGGLTVFRSIAGQLPGHDLLYLGDNSRAPYGNRSFNTIHQYTWECVQWLLAQGCPLVILACNTASAKALRTIQQKDLPVTHPDRRVLGVIRPTAEVIGEYTHTGNIGVLGTQGTVASGSYLLEIKKFFPEISVHQQACPLWVPLIESGEYDKPGADHYVKLYLDELLQRSDQIDTILLACTHYPLLQHKIEAHLPEGVKVVAQGDIVAKSLTDYLQRHPEIDQQITRQGTRRFCTTTDDTTDLDQHASMFISEEVEFEFIGQM